MDKHRLRQRILDQMAEVRDLRYARRLSGDQQDADWLNGHLRAFSQVLKWLEENV